MSSLLTQMRPAPSEVIERREGTRQYLPHYPLSRHITIPSASKALDPKPPPFRIQKEGELASGITYTTPYGVLTPHLLDQFARHYEWKTTPQREYVRHYPPIPPPPESGQRFEPRADMLRSTWSGQRDPKGPYEYQKMQERKGQLPEAKAWPLLHKEYVPFPHNAGARSDLFREVRHKIAGRTPEEAETVKDHIRQLVKTQSLNPQYVKPLTHYKGLQNEVRMYEELERPPWRNPVNMTSEYKAQFDKYTPSGEYRRPQFGSNMPMSNTIVRQQPFNYFNTVERPHSLDYLPMPHNITNKVHDVRLVSTNSRGYL